ncbi:alpha/beta fold hydrolase [Alcanivorax sp. 1008]|uniref:alpha/beta fold hydrolase n=1 Tax=Alcanivorax sp. 1008 TaxID=2816853 RepID=UPI001D8FC50E|nr:alpha/beta hydrolase [Alcanivorax sp. 1008]MCC1496082.1 alpha/beta hydrolase [Alcanivorax sp. 1008]
MNFLSTRHGSVAYTQSGSASDATLLMLHNGGTDHTIWKPVIQALGGSYRITAIDWLGYGDSDELTGGDVLEIYADVIKEVIDQLDLQQVILVGNCVGSAAALRFARSDSARSPGASRVKALVLFNVLTAETLTFSSRLAAWMLKLPAGKGLMGFIAGAMTSIELGRDAVVKFQLRSPGQVAGGLRAHLANLYALPANATNLMALGRQVIASPSFMGLERSDGLPPTMVIWGKHNRVLSALRGRRFVKRYHPLASYFEEGGHLVMMEAPKRCAQLIGTFAKAHAEPDNDVRVEERPAA